MAAKLAVGEFRRTVDARHRLSIPGELLDALDIPAGECLLAKERPGSLSLWPLQPWQGNLERGIALIQQKMDAGRLTERLPEVQMLGRLFSTRQRAVQIAGRGRVVIPEGFREFLGAEPDSDVIIVGAAVCLEIWEPSAWQRQLDEEMPRFRQLYQELSS